MAAKPKKIHLKRAFKDRNEMLLEVKVCNPEKPDKCEVLNFIVDSGASVTAIPAEVAKRLEIESIGYSWVSLADGRTVKVCLGYVYINIKGIHVFALVHYNGCTEPLLGYDILSILRSQLAFSSKELLIPLRRMKTLSIKFNKSWVKRNCESCLQKR